MNVFAGLKLYGKKPTKDPHNAVINIIEINGERQEYLENQSLFDIDWYKE